MVQTLTLAGGPTDHVTTALSGSVRAVGPAVCTVWDAETGGTRYDVTVDGTTSSSFRIGSEGRIPAFSVATADAVFEVWLQVAGVPGRYRIAVTPGPAGQDGADGAPGGSDDAMSAWVADTASKTRRTLAGSFARLGKATGNGLRGFAKRATAIAIGATTTQVTWLTLLDSMAQGKPSVLRDDLALTLGAEVGWYGNGPVGGGTQTGTVTVVNNDHAAFPTGETWTLASAGASVTWQVGGGSPVCTTIHVFYLKNGAHRFKVQVASNGGAFADEPGYSDVSCEGSGELGVITIVKPVGTHVARVVQVAGTPKFIPAGYRNTAASGFIRAGCDRGGLELADFMDLAQSRANLATWLAVVQPTIASFEARETDHAGLPARLEALFSIITTAAPEVDIIGFGAPWDGRSGTVGTPPLSMTEWVRQTNATVREKAEAAGGVYWDGNDVVTDYATIVKMGWDRTDGVIDLTHPAVGYNRFLAPLMRRDLGLDAVPGLFGRAKATFRNLLIARDITWAGPDPASPTAVMGTASNAPDDVTLKGKRWFNLANIATGIEAWRVVLNGGTTGWVARDITLGSGMAGLWGASAAALEARKNSPFNQQADFGARAFYSPVVAQSVAGAVTIDVAQAGTVVLTLTGNVTSWTFTNLPPSGSRVIVQFVQAASGGPFTVAGHNAAIRLTGGAVTMPTTAGRTWSEEFVVRSGSLFPVSTTEAY